nr:hypothetical protein [Tanacetum cinerariifolium]
MMEKIKKLVGGRKQKDIASTPLSPPPKRIRCGGDGITSKKNDGPRGASVLENGQILQTKVNRRKSNKVDVDKNIVSHIKINRWNLIDSYSSQFKFMQELTMSTITMLKLTAIRIN